MSKVKQFNKFSLSILGILLVLFGAILPLEAANPLNLSKSSSSVDRENYRHYISLSWSSIWSQIKRKRVAGVSRGNFCLVSPTQMIDGEPQANNIEAIWHKNPLFVWQLRKPQTVSLRDGNQIYWQKKVETNQANLVYDGKPLQPGTTYQLIIFNSQETEIKKIRLVSPEQHSQIALDLAEIENKLKSKGIDREKIGLKKADYFTQRQMWSDALWELYSIPNPSDELKEILTQVNAQNFCR